MDILNYLLYLLTSVIAVAIFTKIYLVITPYDELDLIRKGQGAPCISLSGTLIGYSLTLSASAIYHGSFLSFVVWAFLAMGVQLLGYFAMVKIIGNVNDSMQKNNIAVGGLLGMTGLVLGIINAGCLS